VKVFREFKHAHADFAEYAQNCEFVKQTESNRVSFTGSSETHSGNVVAMSSCNVSQAGVVMRHRLVHA
jgi:hypothetical protein